MIKISVRRQRFLKMWAKQFAIGLAIVIAGLTVICGAIIGAVKLGQAYGPGAVFTIIGLLLIMTVIGGVTGSIAEVKLAKLEREEERTMNALKRDDSQYNIDEELEQFRQQIRGFKTSFSKSGKNKIV